MRTASGPIDRKSIQTPQGGVWDSWYYIPPEPIFEFSVKLGSSAVAEFGFGLSLSGCRRRKRSPPD